MKTELKTVAACVEQAADYLEVFGLCDGDSSAQARHLRCVYRGLARTLHPDKYTDPDEQVMAKSGFTRLGEFLAQAQQAIQEGVYGQPVVLATIRTRKAEHIVISQLATGDITTVYTAKSIVKGGETATVAKVAKSNADNDLLQAEAAALKRLRADGTDRRRHPFIPELVDSFIYAQKRKPRRIANVIGRLEGFYSLEQVKKAYPAGLNPLDMAWIWRRLLVALGYAHDNHVVHGAVLPPHVMILPEQHGLVVIDWCYASTADDSGHYPPIKAIVNQYEQWYPKEVMAKQPPGPATDVAMAARNMIYLMGGDPITGNLPVNRVPKAFRAFFKGCLLEKQIARPQDAWQLLGEFDELLERLGPPYFPRRFRPFTMPSGVV